MRRKKAGGPSRAATSVFSFCSPPVLAASLFCLLAGASAGAFLELFLPETERAALWSLLDHSLFTVENAGQDLGSIFINSLAGNLLLLLLIILAGLSVFLFPLAFLLTAYKGMALGFSAALIFDMAGFRGLSVVFTSLVLPGLLLLPAFLLSSAAAGGLALGVLAQRKKGIKKSLVQGAGPYLLLQLIPFGAALGGCLIEAFLSPLLTLPLG